MIKKFLKNMIKINIDIPYEENLVYPTKSITKNSIVQYCDSENLKYEFMDDEEEGNIIVKINGKCYEVIRPFVGRGGYAIICRPN